MKKRTRFVIVLAVLGLCFVFLYPTLKWYFWTDKDDKALALGSREKIKDYVINMTKTDIDALIASAKKGDSEPVSAKYDPLIKAAKKNLKDLGKERPSVWTASALLAAFPGSSEERARSAMSSILEDSYRSKILGIKNAQANAVKLGLDLSGGMSIIIKADLSAVTGDSGDSSTSAKKEAMNLAIDTISSRIDKFGLTEPVIRQQGEDRIYVEIPGAADADKINSIIMGRGLLAFHIVEGSVHAVQSPSSFMGYRTLFDMAGETAIKHCMPQNDIFEAGHFVDHEIVSNIEYDCELRRKRMKDGKARRFLLTMGGAGAQVAKFAGIAKAQKSAVEQKKAALLINMGDHKGRWADLQKEFKAAGILWTMHDDWQKTRAFIDDIREHDVHGVHVFLHDDFYAAVYATNLLMRVCDVMITKPSELSFYPVPKLFIHRVGRHEAWGAIRSSECGDGTIETEASSDLYRTLRVLTSDTDLLDLYCTHIIKNNKQGIYNGAYKVVQKALESTKL